jgi:hypothetical protein
MLKPTHFFQSATLSPVRSGLVLLAALTATVTLSAQMPATTASTAQAEPTLNLQAPVSGDQTYSSSSTSADAAEAPTVASLHPTTPNFADMMQYGGGGRSRYGRPRYRGGNTNADGSEKYTFFAGIGLTAPIGNTLKYDTLSYGYQIGAGRNFNKNFGVNFQFDWDEFGLQGRTLQQQADIEDPDNLYGLQGNTDGYSHVWSFTLNPTYTLYSGEKWGGYAVVGGGFYHKITTFTTQELVTGYDYFGFPETFAANEPFDSYTSNAGGVNGGLGVTYKFSHFSNERFYGEVRYVVVFNQQRTGINGSNYNNYASSGYDYPTYNLYPANSNRTTYFPVKFGIRF